MLLTHRLTDPRTAARGRRSRLLAGALLVAGALALPAAAAADTPDVEAVPNQTTTTVAEQTTAAVADVGADPAAPNDAARFPSRGSGLARLDLGEAGRVYIDLPAKGAADESADGLTTVYDATAREAAIALQTTEDGLRAVINIDGPQAPRRYAFALSGDVERLVTHPDGSVEALDAAGVSLVTLAPAWAQDAAGQSVATRYEIRGTTLTQVVSHEGAAYPVVADPLITNSCHFPWFDCHIDINRKITHFLCTKLCRYSNTSMGVIATAAAAACALVPGAGETGLFEILCAGAAAIAGGYFIDNLVYADAHHRCLDIHYGLTPFPHPGKITTDNGSGCRNS